MPHFGNPPSAAETDYALQGRPNKRRGSVRLDSLLGMEKEMQLSPLSFLATIAAATEATPIHLSTKENLRDTKPPDDPPVVSLDAPTSLLGEKKPFNDYRPEARQSNSQPDRACKKAKEQTQNGGLRGTASFHKFTCGIPKCSDSFEKSTELSQHLRTDHNPQEQLHIKPYVCAWPGCQKKYKNLNGLQYHIRRGTCSEASATSEEETKPFQCPDPNCRKRYKNQNGLQYHMMKAKDNGHVIGKELSSVRLNSSEDSAVLPNHSSQIWNPITSNSIYPGETSSITPKQRDTGEVTTYKAQQSTNTYDDEDESVRNWIDRPEDTFNSTDLRLSSFAQDISDAIKVRGIDLKKNDTNIAAGVKEEVSTKGSHVHGTSSSPGMVTLKIPTYEEAANSLPQLTCITALPTTVQTPTIKPIGYLTDTAIGSNADRVQHDFCMADPTVNNEPSKSLTFEKDMQMDKIFAISSPSPSVSPCEISLSSSENIGWSLSLPSSVVEQS